MNTQHGCMSIHTRVICEYIPGLYSYTILGPDLLIELEISPGAICQLESMA